MAGGKKEFARGDLFQVPPEDIYLVGIDGDDDPNHVLAPDPANKQPLDEAMIANVMYVGILEPIWARKVKISADEQRVECIFGRTRVLHAREANRRLVEQGRPPVRVPTIFKTMEEKALVAALVSENEMRRVTSPLEKARALQRAYARGITPDEAASLFKVVPASIDRWEKLASLHPAVLAQLEAGEINATHALAVADAPQGEQPAMLADAMNKATANGKRATGARVKRAAKPGDEYKPLKPRVFQRLAALDKEHKLLPEPVAAFLNWIAYGDKASVEGLADLLKLLEAKPKGRIKTKATAKTPKAPKKAKEKKTKVPKKPTGVRRRIPKAPPAEPAAPAIDADTPVQAF